MTNSTTEMTLESLRSVPLFASLDDHAATELRSLLTSKQVTSGKQLFHKGDSGDAMYLIESGRVRISIRDEDGNEVTLAELAQGDFFGEMALIDGRQRSADASVFEDAQSGSLIPEGLSVFRSLESRRGPRHAFCAHGPAAAD